MRGRIAAACAAVLVALATPGAYACASLAAASCAAVTEASARYARALACAAPLAGDAGLRSLHLRESGRARSSARRPALAAAPRIWRSPSGPAPSQAPPAL